MDKHLQTILNFIENNKTTSKKEKTILLEAVAIQERELKIEAALERVRARTLEMQKSEELANVIKVTYEQLVQLISNIDSAGFDVDIHESSDWNLWHVDRYGEFPDKLHIPYFDHPLPNAIREARNSGAEKIEFSLTFEEKNTLFDQIFKYVPAPQDYKEVIYNVPGHLISEVLFKDVALYISNSAGKPYTDAENDTLLRFGKVFQQTYNRFLDLEKAEAQAREAKIENALEKVRSHSMGMQKSDELRDVIQVIYDQLIQFIPNMNSAGFNLEIRESDDWNLWVADNITQHPNKMHIPYFDHPLNTARIKARISGAEKMVLSLSFEEKNEMFDQIFKYVPISQEAKEAYYSFPGYQISEVFFKDIALHINNYQGILFTDAENDTLLRFGKVFQQTYIRFLDLEKAEAQAREAQIEAALEKVRSRSLAMHKTNELQDVVAVVFEKLQELNFGIDGAAFIGMPVPNTKEIDFWLADDHHEYPTCFRLPYYDAPTITDIWKARESGSDFYSKIYSKKEKNKWFEYAFNQSDLKILPHEIQQRILEQEFLTQSFAFSKNSMVGIHCHFEKVFSEDEIDILKRFSKVFEQGYVRFLDLEKAEAQAREAQIEVALEKVRSRSLAMHRGDELKEVISIVFEKLRELNVSMDSACILTFNQIAKGHTVWAANPDLFSVMSTYVPYNDDPIMKAIYDLRESGENFMDETWTFEEKNMMYEYFFEHTDWKHLPDDMKQMVFNFEGWGMTGLLLKHSATLLVSYSQKTYSEHEIEIIKRFGIVFEQAYIRYLDLEKAEAQAREAQIETALERVRSRTMGMQRSEELQDAAIVLFEQIETLGIPIFASGFNIWDEDKNACTAWMAGKDRLQPPFKLSSAKDIHRLIYEADQRGESFFVKEQGGLELEAHYKYLSTIPEIKEMAEAGVSFPTFQIVHCAFFSKGYLMFITYEPVPTAYAIFKRFSKVFEQTYTRFLDLQKAEAQAREAQIEVALEKVRSRTLAMHKSEELTDVATVLFQQVKSLGISQWTCGFSIWELGDKEFTFYPGSPDGDIMPACKVPLTEHPIFMKFDASRRRGDELYIYEKKGKEQEDHYEYMLNHPGALGDMMQNMLDSGLEFPDFQIDHLANFAHGNLIFVTYEHFPEMHDVFKRFANVFEQTYTRFLDLKKAEAQAKEAQIETSLERVRSRSMGMQKSVELRDVIKVINEQLLLLNFEISNAGFLMDYRETDDYNIWMADAMTELPSQQHIPYFDHLFNKEYIEQKDSKIASFSKIYSFEEKNSWLVDVFKYMPELPTDLKVSMLSSPGLAVSRVLLKNIGLYIFNYNGTAYSDSENATLIRFCKVFEQTYIRFNDLKQAEAQAREAQIEAALERIRSRSLAMQSSSELNEILSTVFKELVKLNIDLETSIIWIFNTEDQSVRWWHYNPEDENGTESYLIPYLDHEVYHYHWKAWKERRNRDLYILEGKNKETWDDLIFNKTEMSRTPIDVQNNLRQIENGHLNNTFHDFGLLMIATQEPISENNFSIIERFGKVFDQSYTRFKDIQQAEERTKEAQIEAALERVRSRSMGMQKSEELRDIIQVIFDQLVLLNFDIDGAGFAVDYRDSDDWNLWTADRINPIPSQIHIPYFDHPMSNAIIDAKNSGQQSIVIKLTFEEKNSLWDHMFKHVSVPKQIQDAIYSFPGYVMSKVLFEKVDLYISNFKGILYTEEENATLLRFGKVFEQTYIRFNDLKQAEAQAKEAQIEASLERIRTQAMSMKQSDDLVKSTTILFEELEKLNLSIERSGIGIFDKETRDCHLWTTVVTPDGNMELTTGITSLTVHPMLIKTFDAWRSQETMPYVLEGKELKDYYKLVSKSEFHLPDEVLESSALSTKEYYLYTPFGAGGLYVFSNTETSIDEKQILRRFADVFHLTHTRFQDLQKAEARALEAVKQASLDRVRAEIASMRQITDLKRITPLIWKELEILGVPFIRCGVFIMDKKRKVIQTHLSTPNGKSLAIFEMPFESSEFSSNALKYWTKKEIYQDHWARDQFVQFMQDLVDNGFIKNMDSYQGSATPPESLHLNFIPFQQGMLYVGNSAPLAKDQMELVQSLTNTFSGAYARYEDFNHLEEAKTKVEKALTNLKSAQSQLIQSEKMASLGELTAGIAHEIQNPLNFVNNFSEVSEELLEELEEEIDNNSIDDIKEIITDLKLNLNKINHHGQRASSIVKGMLDHSRTSSGQKELTDLNLLADEYLRLSYHGLRAKDKTFNADFKTEFDEKLPKTEVIPQDIGRVLLNLLNNAFYATADKSKQAGENYKPEVIVSSMKKQNAIEITVKDNGKGIPEHIVDKIFQPFFTTKPTGQGTGLGLSLSYDIIKAHGGELKVDTKKGVCSTFTVKLPLT